MSGQLVMFGLLILTFLNGIIVGIVLVDVIDRRRNKSHEEKK